jgi:hypothetical protein
VAIAAPKISRLTSDYLLPPFDTDLKYAYRVMIRGITGKPGIYHLSLDPNSCILDQFGQPQGCTLMAAFPFEVRLELVTTGDDLTLYELSSDQDLPARFRLVLLDGFDLRECPARLLTLDEDGYVTQIVHLHPTANDEPSW